MYVTAFRQPALLQMSSMGKLMPKDHPRRFRSAA